MLEDVKAHLNDLEIAFDYAGGRGVELACEIDRYRAAKDILCGEDATCPNCGEGQISSPENPDHRQGMAQDFIVGDKFCGNCQDEL